MSDEVLVEIGGQEYRGWTSVVLRRALDSYSTVLVTSPFDPSRAEIRELLRPFRFAPLRVSIGGVLQMSGTVVDVAPAASPSGATVTVTGYAAPAVMEDCQVPQEAWPLSFDDGTLESIFTTITGSLDISLTIEGDTGEAFERLEIEPQTRAQQYLAGVARARGFVLTDSPDGSLLVWRAVAPGAPVARLRLGESPLGNCSVDFDARKVFSEISGYTPDRRGRPGYVLTYGGLGPEALRPRSYEEPDIYEDDLDAAVSASVGRMWGNAAAWTLEEMPTWRDPSGALWRPNTTITVEAPEVMLYSATELLVRSVEFSLEPDKRVATLGVVLPAAFTGVAPEVFPWAG